MKKALLTVAILLTLLITACNRQPVVRASRSDRPSPAAVDGLTARQAMALANRWYQQKQTGIKTNVTALSVNFEFPNGRKKTVPLPSDQMVIAVAPYVERTHPCEIHFMSGCQGELVGEEIAVRAVSVQGDLILDETVRTMYNGFIELWLPRDQEINLSVSHAGKKAEGLITTYPDSNTCITTLQLM